MFIYLKN